MENVPEYGEVMLGEAGVTLAIRPNWLFVDIWVLMVHHDVF